ncbi:MAG: hypothetical protein K8T89_10665 [Planctomycetes bacterium]|nr:hypothetical protein [Planctomycetota bacterium]
MKFSTLLEMIGSGSVLLIIGGMVLVSGIGIGFSEATHVPLWASFCGLGLFTAIVGFALVNRGSEEAEEQVKDMPMIDAMRNPLWVIGAAIVGGFLLSRILRRPRYVDVAGIVPVSADQIEKVAALAESPKEKKSESFSLSDFLGNQFRSLGTAASAAAISMGINALGVPSVETLIDELMGSEKPKPEKSEAKDTPPAERSVPRDEVFAGAPSNGSRENFAVGHNGFSYYRRRFLVGSAPLQRVTTNSSGFVRIKGEQQCYASQSVFLWWL